MPEGFKKYFSVIIGAILAMWGVFSIPFAVLSNDWSELILYIVLFIAGIWILSWALKE